jgi:hypothetical protein
MTAIPVSQNLGMLISLTCCFSDPGKQECQVGALKQQTNFAHSTLQQSRFISILIPDKVDVGAAFHKERVLVCVWITSWTKQISM